MFLRFFRGQEPLFDVDSDPTGSAAIPPPVAPVDPAQPSTPPAPVADPEPAATPTDDPTDEDEDDGDAPELTSAEWEAEAGRVRKQAARLRVQRNAARTELATAQARVAALEAAQAAAPQSAAPDPEARVAAAERRAAIAEAAAEAGVPAALLRAVRDLESADSAEARTAAFAAIKSHMAPASAGMPLPPSGPASAPTLDQQIADAERRGDVHTSLRLKAQKSLAH